MSLAHMNLAHASDNDGSPLVSRMRALSDAGIYANYHQKWIIRTFA